MTIYSRSLIVVIFPNYMSYHILFDEDICSIKIILREKTREFQETSIAVLLTMLKPLTVWITTNWKILKEMGISDHLTCLLRNLYAGQEATVRNWIWNDGLFPNY